MSNQEHRRIRFLLALMGYGVIVLAMLSPEAKADPFYTKEQLQEAVPFVHTVISVGGYNRRAAEIGLVKQTVVEGSIYDYCTQKPGWRSVACVDEVDLDNDGAAEFTMFLSRSAGRGAVIHELRHTRRILIEHRTWDQEKHHIGW